MSTIVIDITLLRRSHFSDLLLRTRVDRSSAPRHNPLEHSDQQLYPRDPHQYLAALSRQYTPGRTAEGGKDEAAE